MDPHTYRQVLIVSNRLFREGLEHLLQSTGASFHEGKSTVAEAVAQMEAGKVPDLVIAVVSTEDANADAFLSVRLARARFPKTRWLLLTNSVTSERLRKAAAAGIDGLLPQDVSGRVLVHAVELLMLGQPLVPSALAWAVPAAHAGAEGPAANPEILPLTQREHQILDGLVKGHTNKLIAKHLGIADTTVKVHVRALLRKLEVSNRTQAAILALNLNAPEQDSAQVVNLARPSGLRS